MNIPAIKPPVADPEYCAGWSAAEQALREGRATNSHAPSSIKTDKAAEGYFDRMAIHAAEHSFSGVHE